MFVCCPSDLVSEQVDCDRGQSSCANSQELSTIVSVECLERRPSSGLRRGLNNATVHGLGSAVVAVTEELGIVVPHVTEVGELVVAQGLHVHENVPLDVLPAGWGGEGARVRVELGLIESCHEVAEHELLGSAVGVLHIVEDISNEGVLDVTADVAVEEDAQHATE